jgi:histidyl-tRNA synthetase
MYAENPVNKLFYIGPMFRRERPQAGRFRQFHQIGAEALGVTDPEADVEVLALLSDLFRTLGVQGVELQINSLGCKDCRPKYREALIGFLDGKRPELCEDCQRRIDTNPLRALDCKAKSCKEATVGAPSMADSLDDDCRTHFDAVKAGLGSLGINYSVNPRMVRGLDYYTRTTFEMIATDKEGAQNAVAAGGRYDGLVSELGGPEIPGIGFALGMERLIGMLPDGEYGFERPTVFVAALGDGARAWALPAIHKLRDADISCEWDYAGASLKSQMKKANKAGARYALIVGENEMAKGKGILRDMESKIQFPIGLHDDFMKDFDALTKVRK